MAIWIRAVLLHYDIVPFRRSFYILDLQSPETLPCFVFYTPTLSPPYFFSVLIFVS